MRERGRTAGFSLLLSIQSSSKRTLNPFVNVETKTIITTFIIITGLVGGRAAASPPQLLYHFNAACVCVRVCVCSV